jgi:tetratricopeptide (TPR) repeat protein
VEDTFREPTLLHITEAQAVGGDGVGARRTTALLTINYVHLSGLAFAVEGLVRAGDKADAKKLLTETRVQIDSQRDPFTQAICFSHLTKGAKMLGEDVTAKRLAERSVQAANRISNPQNKPDVLRPAAVALAAVGERTRAYDAAAQIGKVKEVPISTFIEVMTLLLIGQVQHRFGDASGAKEAFGRAHQEVNRLSGGELFKAYLEMMYYQSKTGDRDGVRECYRLAREYLKPQNDPGIKLTAEIILAGVLAIAREREEAQAVLKGLEGDPAVIAGIRILRAELDPNPPSPLRPEFIPEIKEA